MLWAQRANRRRVDAETDYLLGRGRARLGHDDQTIVHHANGVEIQEFAKKVGVITPPDAWRRPDDVRAHREAYCAAIRDHNARGASARTWTVQYVIRHSAYHMLDHAWEMEDRDLSGGS